MTHRTGIAVAALLLTTACDGDVTRSSGERGMLSYGLYTDYEGEQDELTDLPLLTGYTHRIAVSLTPQGQDALGSRPPGTIRHSATEATVVQEPDDDDFDILSEGPGSPEITSTLDGAPFDRITLQFDDPTGLDLVEWIRAPWESDFVRSSGTEAEVVAEGSQISFLAVPMAGETRLGGDFVPEITVSPEGLAVPDAQVFAVQEGGVTVIGEPITFYAIDPGTVTFTIADPVHQITVERTFEIVAE